MKIFIAGVKQKKNLEEQKKMMLAGQIYDDLTEELIEARKNAVIKTNEFNASFEKTMEERILLLKGLLQSVGNNVWIGGGVTINQGVTIGDNSIIGSESVVTKSIPANVIAAGVPCRVIRAITEEDKSGYVPYHKQ